MGSRPGREPIRPLDEATVAEIAAGEVVERPASVVKELIENALDANAREVRVELAEGGLRRVEVTDDGEGILPDELDLAVQRHATSKIRSAEDLERAATLGFRGEALAAIGAVSSLSVSSRVMGSDEGAGVRVVGGRRTEHFHEGRPVGSTVRVERLFFNTPARRKFLRSPGTEAQESVHVVERAYLARTTVGFSVALDGRPATRYPPTRSLRDAASTVLGPEFLEHAIPFEAELGDGVSVNGVVAHPALHRGNSLGLFVSVNGRPVESKSVSAAVRLAYQDYLPRTRFPVGVIQLRVPPGRLDVNVHPTKRDVRLAGEREVTEAIRRTVRRSLQLAPEMATPPASARDVVATETDRPRLGPATLGSGPAIPLPLGTSVVQRRLAVASPDLARGSSRSSLGLDLVGPVFSLYWVAATAEGMVLIDQHAASERLLFDTLRRDGGLARQVLVDPVRVELTARQQAALDEHEQAVRSAGFTVEAFGGHGFRVTSVPVFRGSAPKAEALRELLEELAAGGRPTIPNGFADRRAASIACHAAVRAGDVISPETMRRILEDLKSTVDPAYACPHGRPIRIVLPRGRIDQWFLRRGT